MATNWPNLVKRETFRVHIGQIMASIANDGTTAPLESNTESVPQLLANLVEFKRIEVEQAQKLCPALLEHSSVSLPTTNIVEQCKAFTPEEISQKMQTVKRLCPLDQEQSMAYDTACSSLEGRLAVIKGYAGTGKTWVLAMISLFYMSIGIHVLLGATTVSSTDELLRAICELLSESADPMHQNVQPVRVHQRIRKFETGAQLELTTGHGDLIDYQVLSAIYSSSLLHPNVWPISLESRAIELAKSQKGQSRLMYDLSSGAEGGVGPRWTVCGPEDDTQEGTEDMYEYLRTALEHFTLVPFDSWPQEDKRKLSICFRVVCERVIAQAACVVSTVHDLGSPVICRFFGQACKEAGNGYMVMIDHDSVDSYYSSTSWSNLVNAPNMLGLILSFDHRHLSARLLRSLKLYTPSEQMPATILTRLQLSEFPATMLSRQHRMHPDLAIFPASRQRGSYQNAVDTRYDLDLPTKLKHAITNWIEHENAAEGDPNTSQKVPKFVKVNYIAINVEDGELQLDTPSDKFFNTAYNTANINVTMSLIIHLQAHSAFPASTAIITPFEAQATRYMQRLKAMCFRRKLSLRHLNIEVVTCDEARGRQWDFCIADPVVTCSATVKDLSKAAYSEEMSLMHTRARKCFVLLVHPSLTKSPLADNRVFRRKMEEALLHPELDDGEQPYLIRSMKYRAKNGQLFSKRGLPLGGETYESDQLFS